MKAMNKIIMGAAVLSLLACSENSTSASDGVAEEKGLSSSSQNPSSVTDCKPICDQETEICADVCADSLDSDTLDSQICESYCDPESGICTETCSLPLNIIERDPYADWMHNNHEYPYDNVMGGDMLIPALMTIYNEQHVFEDRGLEMDSSVIAYYTRTDYAELNLSVESGITKLDDEALAKITPVSDKLSLRGNTEGCSYYALVNELSNVESDNMVTEVSKDSVVITMVLPDSGSCSPYEMEKKEVYFLEICGAELEAEIPVVVRSIMDTTRSCNAFSYNWGKWFRSDLYSAHAESVDDPDEEMPLPEVDFPVETDPGETGCYSPCPPDADICIDVCADHPYVE